MTPDGKIDSWEPHMSLEELRRRYGDYYGSHSGHRQRADEVKPKVERPNTDTSHRRDDNSGAVSGAIIGGVLGGPEGAVEGAIVGSLFD